ELGFKTNPFNKYRKNPQGVFSYYNNIAKKRESIPYEIDGIVVIINSNEIFEKLGVVGKAPRGAIAFKFPGAEATTVVEDIKAQVGRTGVLTPVAYLRPVVVGGATVSRATLHNEDEIKRLGIKIGDTVIVSRAGDVIPKITKVLIEMRDRKTRLPAARNFKMPEFCPSCETKIIRDGAMHRCPNPKCFAQKREYFYHFISRPAFNMDGLGPKIIDRLIEKNLISDPADLFKLKEGDFLSLKRFGEKSAENATRAIQEKKEITFSRFIFSLGIRNIGEKTAYDLAKYFNNSKELKTASLENLKNIRDIGPIVAKSIYEWFRNDKNIDFLGKLQEVISIKYQAASGKREKLKNKSFVLTGTLFSLPRDEAKARIIELGGETSESVLKNTDYVVAGENPGSKLEKAKKLGVKIIDEKEFLSIIR
ncbi:MAG: NAD-dependent DNA ligase LigA, partial [bacterium]|nr:NAD-dependent DNA ligase LigA [bacterium]